MKRAANGFGSTAGAAMLLMAFAATATRTDSTAWVAFASRWTGRQAVLQHAIYDVSFSPLRSKGSTAVAYKFGVTTPVTFLEPGIGLTYRFQFGGQTVTSSDPKALVEKAQVLIEQTDVAMLSKLEVPATDSAGDAYGPAVLVTHNTGTTMTISRVMHAKRSITFALMPEGTTERRATSLTVEMPHPISDEFTEQADVEQLVGSVLQMTK
jgi:hypothetical protein